MLRILQFLQGPSGKTSAMRVGSLGVLTVYWLTWAWVSVAQIALQPIDAEAAVITLGVLGLKAGQRYIETQEAKSPHPPKPPQT